MYEINKCSSYIILSTKINNIHKYKFYVKSLKDLKFISHEIKIYLNSKISK